MKNKTSFFAVLFFLVSAVSSYAQIITTVAGGHQGSLGDGGPATDAGLAGPIAVAFDAAGNFYITDRDDNRIRKVATDGIITTIAGTGGAGYNGDSIAASTAQLNTPYGIAVDKAGNIIFSDNGNDRIRKIDASGIITTIAGTGMGGYNGDSIPATAVNFLGLGGIAYDTSGNLFLVDLNRVRKINTMGIVTTIAGTGIPGYNGDEIPGTNAELNKPNDVAVDKAGNVYIADNENHRIRKVDISGTIHTIAGTGTSGYIGDNGPASAAELFGPGGVCLDNWGNIYISDTRNNVLRKINNAGTIATIAGNKMPGFSGDGGLAISAEISSPIGVLANATGDIYFADASNNRIRFIESTVSVSLIQKKDNLTVYPNPFITEIKISVQSDKKEKIQMEITNILGENIKELVAYSNEVVQINLNGPAGLYFLSVKTDDATLIKKIVKTR